MRYTIGIDYGTMSCRALVMDALTGAVCGISECVYHVYEGHLPDGTVLPDRMALADAAEYRTALVKVVRDAIAAAKINAADVVGMAVDATSMSLVPCKSDGTALCCLPEWKSEPHAYIRLWKSYTATREAEEIGSLAREQKRGFLAACGGYPSSEGAYPKMLETIRKAPEVYEAADVFVDLGEWLNWQLTGELTRDTGTMGLKNYCWDGKTLADADFWPQLDSRLTHVNDKLRGEILPWGSKVGSLTAEMASEMGLKAGISIGAAGLDGHCPIMAIGLHNVGDAMLTIGTSGVLAILATEWKVIPGVCGAGWNTATPGYYAYDMCQSGVGDMFGWFVKNCVPARYEEEGKAQGISVHTLLSRKGFALPVRPDAPVAVDWWNGSRCVVVDQTLSGAISGLRLSTTPEEIYCALVQAAAFGVRVMIEHAENCGVPVNRICVCGGIAAKNPLLVQCYADILGRTLEVSTLPNSAAAGAAIGATAAAGIYSDLNEAMAALSTTEFIVYEPDMQKHAAYEALYSRYLKMREDIRKE